MGASSSKASSCSISKGGDYIGTTVVMPGDHIYFWEKPFYLYAHHGIYIGNGIVIHSIKKSSVIEMCSIQMFLNGEKLRIYRYGVNCIKLLRSRRGTCTMAKSDPSADVIHRAQYLHDNVNGSVVYNIFMKNSEDFALYCKTGFIKTGRPVSGGGEVDDFSLFTVIQFVLYKLVIGLQAAGFVCPPIFIVMAGLYLLSIPVKMVAGRYWNDIEVRNDVIRASVEELVESRGTLSFGLEYNYDVGGRYVSP